MTNDLANAFLQVTWISLKAALIQHPYFLTFTILVLGALMTLRFRNMRI